VEIGLRMEIFINKKEKNIFTILDGIKV